MAITTIADALLGASGAINETMQQEATRRGQLLQGQEQQNQLSLAQAQLNLKGKEAEATAGLGLAKETNAQAQFQAGHALKTEEVGIARDRAITEAAQQRAQQASWETHATNETNRLAFDKAKFAQEEPVRESIIGYHNAQAGEAKLRGNYYEAQTKDLERARDAGEQLISLEDLGTPLLQHITETLGSEKAAQAKQWYSAINGILTPAGDLTKLPKDAQGRPLVPISSGIKRLEIVQSLMKSLGDKKTLSPQEAAKAAIASFDKADASVQALGLPNYMLKTMPFLIDPEKALGLAAGLDALQKGFEKSEIERFQKTNGRLPTEEEKTKKILPLVESVMEQARIQGLRDNFGHIIPDVTTYLPKDAPGGATTPGAPRATAGALAAAAPLSPAHVESNKQALVAAAQRKGLTPDQTAVVLAIVQQESEFDHRKVHDGGTGWGMGGTHAGAAKDVGVPVDKLHDPQWSAEATAEYFRQQLVATKGDIRAALERYNGGGDSQYVEHVMQHLQQNQAYLDRIRGVRHLPGNRTYTQTPPTAQTVTLPGGRSYTIAPPGPATPTWSPLGR